MADVEFTAGFQDLKTLQGILENNIPKAARDSAAAMETAFRKQEAAVNRLIKRNESLGQTALSVTKGNQAYYNSVLGITKAKTDLTAKTSLLVRGLEEEARASKEKSVATQREAKELERLRQSYDPLYRASQLYAKQEAELQVLMNSGVGSTQRYQQALDQLNKEYQDFGNGVATATNRFASNAKGAQRGMNGLGMAMQQTGYQVGDFLVQIQGGTNPMVAFGQQATQLVGVLYLLPPAALAASRTILGVSVSVTALIASLGIIIPLATAVGAAIMRTREANNKATESTKGFSDRLKSAREEVRGMADDLRLLQSGFEEAFQLTLSDSIEVAEEKLKEARENLLNTMAAQTGMAAGAGIDIGAFFRLSPEDAEAAVKAAEKELEAAKRTAWELRNIKDIRERTVMVINSQAEATEAVRAKAEDHLALVSSLEVEFGEATVTAFRLLGVPWEDMAARLGNVADEAGRLASNLEIARSFGQGIGGEFAEVPTGLDPFGGGGDYRYDLPSTFKPPKKPKIGGGGGGGGGGKKGEASARENSLESFIKSLQTEQEALTSWYTEQQDLLAQFNEKELEVLGGHNEAKLRLDAEYAERKKAIEKSTYETVVSSQQAAMSALQGFMGTLAGQSKTAAKAVLAINTAMSISQAIQNTAVAATRALAELGPVAGPPAAAKIKMYGAAQVGLIAANAALKMGSSSGGGGGGGVGGGSSGSAITTPTAQEQQGPQEVLLRGLKPGMRLSPEELQEVFDQIYDENDRRGTIFRVDLS